MDRAVITFVVALTLSATAWAGNWNSSSSTQKKLQTQNSIAALSGFGVNIMALLQVTFTSMKTCRSSGFQSIRGGV